ncbi:MAG: UDP-N-acetylmuramoyl-L-alanyl-D-glutamate--2,6-diaminopimelate ligase [Clostridiales bacterium]|nr:UDP-N-acetylmuramoyl-L-alanyl-D-glutamate--2,6-diaminopimelate ligase [Clostridiales bacterium]
MKLRELIVDMPYLLDTRGDMDVNIGAVNSNSKAKAEKGVFFCIPGARFDAHDYAPQAIENGCVALVVERFLDIDVPQVRVSNARAAMSRMAAAFYGHPARGMKLVGITGTKGKTTSTYMLKAILEKAGHKVGLIGTTGNMIGDKLLKGSLTTPDPIDLQRTLRMMADEGVEYVTMEISAHAIDMHRLDGLTFEVGCYTNLSQDHLDYFHTMENYFETKKKFFTTGMVRNASVNVDEETSAGVLSALEIPCLTYGICAPADLFARDIEITEEGVSFEVQLRGMHPVQINLMMTGMFNVYNAMAAASCAMVLGVSAEDIKAGLEGMPSVPGRIEMLPTGTPYRVILDYSHVPDALENILTTVRQFAKGRVIALFGCGGDRDQGKRPMMGAIGGKLADLSILTSDNPRTEDPMKILAAIEEGIKPTGGEYVVIENRRAAIRYAMEIAEASDIIVLAGKGHETYQEIKGVKYPFDEKVVVQELLQELNAKK